MAYADYSFYTNVYLGNIITESEFERMAQRASDIIDVFTSDRITPDVISNENIYTKIKKANCALAEQIYFDEQNYYIGGNLSNSNIHSIKAGEETITYNTDSSSSKTSVQVQKDKYYTALSIISQYLYNTGLLYMGID